MKHSLKVGDVLVYTWGYDQTNVDFFQVVKTTDKTVVVRELMQETRHEHYLMAGTALPKKGEFVGKPIRKTVKTGFSDKDILSFDHGIAHIWNGKPQNYSSYA